jgi:hypothetical protein
MNVIHELPILGAILAAAAFAAVLIFVSVEDVLRG